MNSSIQEWLNGRREYYQGVQLYQQHGSDALLKLLFTESWSEFKQRRLVAALEKVAGDEPVIISPAPQTVFAVVGVCPATL